MSLCLVVVFPFFFVQICNYGQSSGRHRWRHRHCAPPHFPGDYASNPFVSKLCSTFIARFRPKLVRRPDASSTTFCKTMGNLHTRCGCIHFPPRALPLALHVLSSLTVSLVKMNPALQHARTQASTHTTAYCLVETVYLDASACHSLVCAACAFPHHPQVRRRIWFR